MLYFDHASTTYVYPEVAKLVNEVITKHWGNPMNLHSDGLDSKNILETSRETIAEAINASPSEIIFTSCSSESNALAINQKPYGICSPYEHHDIKDNDKMTIVDEEYLNMCVLATSEVEMLINQFKLYLYAHMLVNNETGEIFEVKNYVKAAHALGMAVLIDATQALGNIPIDVKEIGADFMSFSFHKVHAPKGIGALYISEEYQKEHNIKPLIYGTQENNMRGGTSNVPYIAGSAMAVSKAIDEMDRKNDYCTILRNTLIEDLKNYKVPFIINEGKKNIPSILNIAFPNITGESMMLALDAQGIRISTGSACLTGDHKPSEVLSYMKVPDQYIQGAIRISMSLENKVQDIHYLAKEIANAYFQLGEKI